MDTSISNVVVQVAASSLGMGGAAPVFSVVGARSGLGVGQGQVQISAAAQALAAVSTTGARPQLNLMVQMVGALGSSATRQLQPFSAAVIAAERLGSVAADSAARAQAAQDALARQAAESAELPNAKALEAPGLAVPSTPATAAAVSVSQTSIGPAVAAYQSVQAPVADPVVNVDA